jgi:hypothetical protein
MIREAGVRVFFGQRLREQDGVVTVARRIAAINTESGAEFRGAVFIDASYEGDLMAQADVPYTVGREAEATYGEPLAGVQPAQQMGPPLSAHYVSHPLQQLPGVGPAPSTKGSSDNRVQPYDFRLCFTREADNRTPFPRPVGYRPATYALLQRHLDGIARWTGSVELSDVLTLAPIPNGKYDVNAASAISTDQLNVSWEYADADYHRRDELWTQLFQYDAGLIYYLANDPAVPEGLRDEINQFGLCSDEWPDTGNWPPLLYLREGRRMVSEFVLTQHDLVDEQAKRDSIGLAAYRVDSHSISLFSGPDGTVYTEGAMNLKLNGPYEIPYRILVPAREALTNLLVTVTVSASHVAYASLRMEPQFMVMGEGAGTAAALAADTGTAVQDVDLRTLQARLAARGVRLHIR